MLADLIEPNYRILIIDDNQSIHVDLRNALDDGADAGPDLQDDEALLFGTAPPPVTAFEIDSAYQGKEGLEKVSQAIAEGRPYALAFVDIRMPPGWDGVETITRLRQADPNLQTVICTAYSDYSWNDLQKRLGHSDNLLILKKPFDSIEVIQLAHALSRKWLVTRQAEAKMAELDLAVAERTSQLESAHERIRRELEERARVQEAFRIIFEASAIGIFLTDANHCFLDLNRAAATQFGLEKQEAIGKDPFELGILDRQTLEEVRLELDGNGSIDTREIAYGSAGEWRIGLLWERIVRIQDATRYLGFILDITERKRMEEDLQRARVAAEAGARAKSEFLANMSHEIRTPMNGIVGFTHLTLQTPLTLDQRGYLETVEISAQALLRIINDILDFSKIEAGHLELERESFSLRETVSGAARTIAPEALRKGLDLSWDIDPGVPEALLGDATRLRQVLLNLLGNAAKFTAKGLIRVEVHGQSARGGAPELHFVVRDSGIGIPPEQQQVIFEAFRQADGSTTRKYGGTGLGLAISARLVGSMRGKIWVESQAGHGSAFHFTACFGAVTVPQAAAEARVVPEDPDRPSLAVLVVEDDPISRTLASTVLTHNGHSVATAANGVEALGLVERRRFDVILMDIQMPRMDGIEATGQIRRRESRTGGRVPIVAMTAHAMKGDRERCLAAGMDDYISKPIDMNQILAIVGKIGGFRNGGFRNGGAVPRNAA